jgi:hypothetical protein
MALPRQSLQDRVLWLLTNRGGTADLRYLRKLIEIPLEDLLAVLDGLEREGRIIRIPPPPREDKQQEYLRVWVCRQTRTTKKGSRKYAYWMATWRKDWETRKVYLGSCSKIDEEAARQKAEAMKALAIKL